MITIIITLHIAKYKNISQTLIDFLLQTDSHCCDNFDASFTTSLIFYWFSNRVVNILRVIIQSLFQ